MTRNNGLDNETYKLTRGISLECLGVLRFDKEYGMWIKYSRRRKIFGFITFFLIVKRESMLGMIYMAFCIYLLSTRSFYIPIPHTLFNYVHIQSQLITGE